VCTSPVYLTHRVQVTRSLPRPADVPEQKWTERSLLKARELNGGRCPPNWPPGQLVTSRELQGLSSPWYFSAPPAVNASLFLRGWSRLIDPAGFRAPWGPRTAERSDQCYMYASGHECAWNGPTWPFETSKLITAAINVLHDYADAARQSGALDASTLWSLIAQYAQAHTHASAVNASDWELSGLGHSWIGEALHPDEGYWLVRKLLYDAGNRGRNRGARYNHSTFCDLILQLLGLRPSTDRTLTVHPLLPADTPVQYFAIDGVAVQGHDVAVLFDRDGSRYGRGAGLRVLLDGAVVASGALGDTLVVQL